MPTTSSPGSRPSTSGCRRTSRPNCPSAACGAWCPTRTPDVPVDERGDVNADRAARVAAVNRIPEHSSDRLFPLRVADTWVDDPLTVLTGYAHRYGKTLRIYDY